MYLSNDNLATGAAWIAQLCCHIDLSKKQRLKKINRKHKTAITGFQIVAIFCIQ